MYAVMGMEMILFDVPYLILPNLFLCASILCSLSLEVPNLYAALLLVPRVQAILSDL